MTPPSDPWTPDTEMAAPGQEDDPDALRAAKGIILAVVLSAVIVGILAAWWWG